MRRKIGLELVDDIGNDTPNVDVFSLSDVDFRIVRIFWHEIDFPPSPDEPLNR